MEGGERWMETLITKTRIKCWVICLFDKVYTRKGKIVPSFPRALSISLSFFPRADAPKWRQGTFDLHGFSRGDASGPATILVSVSTRRHQELRGFWVDERGYAARWGRLVTDSLQASRRRRHLCAFSPSPNRPLSTRGRDQRGWFIPGRFVRLSMDVHLIRIQGCWTLIQIFDTPSRIARPDCRD